MYFSIGWPKYLELHGSSPPIHVFCNRDRSLFGVLTEESISLWFVRPCVETTFYKRSQESLVVDGTHCLAEWRPDSSMIVISTSSNHLHFYNVEVYESLKGLFEQYDSKVTGLRRESAELFTKEKVPPISLVFAHNLTLPGVINSIVCIRDELMVATDGGHIWRVQWDGTVNREYSLDLCMIPFCIDQQQSKGLHFNTDNICVINLEYSPLIGGFSIVLSSGQAAFITASTLKFQPDQTFGILAQDVNNATCTAVNHRYRLIAYGLNNAQGIVYCFDDITGALQVTHRLVLSSKDFPDVISAAGCVTNLKWTPDGGALAMTWTKGGIAIWSVFGALIMCTLGWDYGVADVMKNVLKITSIDWGPEGYHLWAVCKRPCHSKATMLNHAAVPEFDTCVAVMQFAKSALTVNPGMTGREHVFLQAEDRLYISAGSDIVHNTASYLGPNEENSNEHPTISPDQMVVGNKQWIIVPIPYSYLGSNWPVRYTAVDSSGQNMVVAGRSGFAHYSLSLKRWKLFGNETQEKDFVVMGGLLWWEDQVILGCYNLKDLRDEIRIYPQDSKLDNQFSRVVKMATQVLQLSCLGDRLLCFCADSRLTLFHLQRKSSPTSSILHVTRLLELDVTNLVFHPACVVSALLTSLCTETGRRPRKGDESILLNVCGRLMLLQQDPANKKADVTNNNNQNVPSYSAPTVLASSVENVWVCSRSSKATPHLTESLWIACGTHGMRVWLPLFPRDGEKHRAHNFMSKRIMLPVNVYIYPIAVLFEDAVILGAENDTVLFSADSYARHPFCVISRTSQVYLHHILRQLLRRNLGYHAWEIARSCATLPYFPHSLELLLHEVLEEEATSSEPIPDALLPRVIDFIQEFPVFLQTVVQCARKTELALWPYLFSAVGNPKNLFRACINQGQLETAASYLIILQNLEVSSVSHQHATILLDSALASCKWELANELVRFLKAIDPNDVESPPRSIGLLHKYALSHATPPVSPTEDDLSFVLGTASLTRGRSHSTVQKMPSVPVESQSRVPPQEPASRTISDPQNLRKRRPSEQKEKCSTVPEEFFIDGLLTTHARKLLSLGKLKDLGYLAAHLDFHLVTFFSKERNKAARVFDFIRALHSLHQDFQWPYPVQPAHFSWNVQSKSSVDSRTPLLPNDGLTHPFSQSVPKYTSTNEVRDSGYISNPSERISLKSDVQSVGSACMDVSGQTIEAFLLPKTARENSLLMFDISENSSLWAEDSQTTVDDDGWQNQPLPPDFETLTEDLVSKGPPHTEVQLRYLLQFLLEAGCLEWSLLIAIVLRDAMAVIRVLNCTRQPDLPPETTKRLRDMLTTIELWAEKHCLGYKAFMLTLHNQAKVLGKIGISGSTPSPSSLKRDSVPYDELYDNVQYNDDHNDHRLSTSSDVPSIEGTLVLQSSGPEIVSDELSGSESDESIKAEEKPLETGSECVIS